MIEFRDILWVEDFDTGDEYEEESAIEMKRYYDGDKRKYSFRVDNQKDVLPLLRKLEAEKNFSSYSCAVLDINLTEGFGSDPKESETAELNAIKEILEQNQVKILDEEHAKNRAEFKENAGYYVYLYLVNRGMPPSRICMLTGNKGNITKEWEEPFINAGFIPPEAFDKEDKIEINNFHNWLEKNLTPAFRLRSCIIGMSFYAEKLLEEETLKVHVQNLYRIPLRLSEDEETASPEFISALWQILQIWESHEDANRAYQMTLRTARNWFAHRCLKKISLLTAAFLFGIGMRGLLGEKIRKKIDAASAIEDKEESKDWKKNLRSIGDKLNIELDNENVNGYNIWEQELLSLIEELDKEKQSAGEKELDDLVIKSCREFFTRIENAIKKGDISSELKIYFTSDICNLIQETIGQKNIKKKDNKIERYGEDLLRDFLHGVYMINWNDKRLSRELKISLSVDKDSFKVLEKSKEAKYLNAVKYTLSQAVDDRK